MGERHQDHRPFIMHTDARVDISLGDGNRAVLLFIIQGKLQPEPGPEAGTVGQAGMAGWTMV